MADGTEIRRKVNRRLQRQQTKETRSAAVDRERPANTPAARVEARDTLTATQQNFVDEVSDDAQGAPQTSDIPSLRSVPADTGDRLAQVEDTVQALLEDDDEETEVQVAQDPTTLSVVNFLDSASDSSNTGNLRPLQWTAVVDRDAPASAPPASVFDDRNPFFNAEPPSGETIDDSVEPDVIPAPLLDVKKRLAALVLAPIEKNKAMQEMFKVCTIAA